jgi:biotin carboxyl carrier protein
MKLIAEVAGEKYQLSMEQADASVVADIEGRRYEARVRETGPGTYLLITDGRVYECRVNRGRGKREAFEVGIGSHAYAVTLADPKRLRSAQMSGAHDADASVQIVAPMPGKVVRVLVETGAQVEAGDGLVIVEAMKMQNEMKSPRAGTVTALHAEAGATVNAGDLLVVVE